MMKKTGILLALWLVMTAVSAQRRVLYIGDSVTDGGWGRSGGSMMPSAQRNLTDLNHIYGHSYMMLCAAHYESLQPFAGLTFMNRGISGNTLADMQARWQQDALDLHPDLLSVLIGVNDVATHLKTHATADDFDLAGWERDYRALLAAAWHDNPQLLIALGTPFVSSAAPAEWQVLAGRLAEAVRRIAKDFGAVLMPYDTLFGELQRRQPHTRYWIWDRVHPTAAGHRRMADLWMAKATDAGWLLADDGQRAHGATE